MLMELDGHADVREGKLMLRGTLTPVILVLAERA
ncbi:hypothetical protein FDG2_5523 [Candidatus Protofrankia californiensis]|uniref:Uncharacterized protein n=1 Tax=Candidatus Protofrankia californiensis TaxID=1839754 RepID=A0A1C3PE07_9ACTN|nr:hypothetical protein FDG2_5523 [Candidatus Protofrankia californiensis]